MKTSTIFFLAILSSSYVFGQTKSFKRGVCYGYHSAADMNTASAGISWWYNWAQQPESAIQNTYADYNVDFTPQAWNAAGIDGVKTWVSVDDKVKYLLGFNEPNFKAQANMTPLQAAAAWPALQAIADQHGLKLVSPAVNYCGDCVSENGTVYNNPFKWLDDFFAACPTCRVDYIALHWYGGGNSMTGFINDARKYGKPIWVTEFANWENGVTPESQKSYLAGTTNFLERDPDVFRYSWFIGRTTGGATTYPYLDLFDAVSGTMTALGQIYLDIPVYDSTKVNQLPGRIEAEEYYKQSGVFSELTKDADGFMNIGYTDNGDWLKYKIFVSESGVYTITSRYAGTTAGTFDIYVDDIKKATVNTTNTSGWQTWASASTEISLAAGPHILKLLVVSKGFNLNWLNILKGATGINEMQVASLEAGVFPNPVIGNKFRITFKNCCLNDISIHLFDPAGKTVYTDRIEKLNGTGINVNLEGTGYVRKGIYTLVVRSKQGYMNRKIVLL